MAGLIRALGDVARARHGGGGGIAGDVGLGQELGHAPTVGPHPRSEIPETWEL